MKNYLSRLKENINLPIVLTVISFLGALSNKNIEKTSHALLFGLILSMIIWFIFLLSYIKLKPKK